jgi:hypothetical protein
LRERELQREYKNKGEQQKKREIAGGEDEKEMRRKGMVRILQQKKLNFE